MRLRAKLVLTINLLLAGVLGVAALTLLRAEGQLAAGDVGRRKAAALAIVAGFLREADKTRDSLLLINAVKLIQKAYPDILWICVFDRHDLVLASSDDDLIGTVHKREARPAGLDVAVVPVDARDVELGRVEVGFDKQLTARLVHDSITRLAGVLLRVGAGVFTMGFLCSLLLAGNLATAIRALCLAAVEIGHGRAPAPVDARRADELGDLARSFQEMSARLRELDVMKQDFVSTVTHELRSPLSAIESHANALLEDIAAQRRMTKKTQEDWEASLTHIKTNSQRLGRFINDLLDMAKIERGKLHVAPVPLALPDIIAEVASFLRPQAAEQRLELAVALPPGLPAVNADPERLHQVLVNLLSNALRFTPAGGRVEISALRESPRWVRVAVSDTGPGVPPEAVGRLFTKFEQLKTPSARAGAGTGLGLAICKAIVEKHGGSIGVEPRLAGGAIFSFTLPVVAA